LAWSFSQDRSYVISPELYRDVKLVMFELANNVMKHADASTLKVSSVASSGRMQIIVEDNGTATQVPEEGSQGNGLRNLRRRIERHQGTALVQINPSGHGFRIFIDVPL
jgi:two-component system sensor histidine kinase DesK